jgi:hypothetical protein
MGGLRALVLATIVLLPGVAAAENLCERVVIPDELGLACSPVGIVSGEVQIQPTDSDFAGLSRMTIRALDRDADALAWEQPDTWLREQVTVNTTGVGSSLRGLAENPDSPFAGDTAQGAVGSVLGLLNQLGRLPLSACEEPTKRGEDFWSMACRYTAGGFGVHLVERLEVNGDRRYAMTMRTMNEQRLRHFEAIANSFDPPV